MTYGLVLGKLSRSPFLVWHEKEGNSRSLLPELKPRTKTARTQARTAVPKLFKTLYMVVPCMLLLHGLSREEVASN